MSKNKNKDRGSNYERYIRDFLRGYGFPAQRTPLSGSIPGWRSDITSPDFPFAIECKYCRQTSFLKWYKKADSLGEDKPAIIVWSLPPGRGNSKEDVYCFLMFSDLMAILTGGISIKEKFKKKQSKFKKLGLDETSNLKFNKAYQIRRKKK